MTTTTTTTSSNPTPNHKPIAWDPKSPATLTIPSTTSTTSKEQQPRLFDSFLSHDGVGCNTNETSALIQILDARDDNQSYTFVPYELQEEEEEEEEAKIRIKLSKLYRASLSKCMQHWEHRLASNENEEEEEEEENNLELLKLMHAVMHLSEIYLLRPSSSSFNSLEGIGSGGEDAPGAVTANTVRYLRFNHMTSPYAFLDEIEEDGEDDENDVLLLDQMLNSTQPEYFKGDGELYWKLIRNLVARGCLEDAWAVLSRHSACRRCVVVASSSMDLALEVEEEEGGGGYDTIKEDRDGFAILHALLLSAPLPGGRNDITDDSLSFTSAQVAQEERKGGGEAAAVLEEMLMEGITRNAYKLWDNHHFLSSDEEGDEDDDEDDVPNRFNPRMASSLHQNWMESVRTAVNSYPLSHLLRRIPRLYRDVLSIILGDYSSSSSSSNRNQIFESWSEALTTELLYARPHLRPSDIHIRALRQMEQFGIGKEEEKKEGFEEIVLSVMKGNAGRVVEALHDLGGGSGAALPATMTALLCNLLTEANQIQPSVSSSSTSSFNIQTELLLSASHSILSSFATQSHSDVGVRLSTRLLLPHATPSSSSSSSNNKNPDYIRITSQIAESINKHVPQNDVETKGLISLCLPLVKLGSKDVLDACESMTLSRFRYFKIKDKRPGGATYWLLRGMELCARFPRRVVVVSRKDGKEDEEEEKKSTARYRYGIVPQSSPSKRHFLQYVTQSSSNLLSALVDDTSSVSDVACYLDIGREILNALQEDAEHDDDEENNNNNNNSRIQIASIVSKYREVKLLNCIVNIALSMIKENYADVAKNVVRCLEDGVMDDEQEGGRREEIQGGGGGGGAVLTLAHPTMYDDLLCLAFTVLDGEEAAENDDPEEEEDNNNDVEDGKENGGFIAGMAAFDVHGIHILMARLSQLIEWEHFDTERLSPKTEDDDEGDDYVQDNESDDDDDDDDMMDENKEGEEQEDGVDATAKLSYTVPQMRLLLCKGLARAFVSENAMKTKNYGSLMSEDVQELNASFIALGREERNVQLMLAPTM